MNGNDLLDCPHLRTVTEKKVSLFVLCLSSTRSARRSAFQLHVLLSMQLFCSKW